MFAVQTSSLQEQHASFFNGPALLVGIVLFSLLSPSVHAQPKAIGPQDIARLQQQTEFTGDWSETEFFNLDRYITLRVTIEHVKMPEGPGNVYLHFTVKNPQRLTGEKSLERDRLFRATLQTAQAVEFMEIDERDFPQGANAVIRGWPATRKNMTGSVFLVDDVNIVGSGKTLSLHRNNPRMQSKRTNTPTSR